MAEQFQDDRSFFGRLKKLFSTNAIVTVDKDGRMILDYIDHRKSCEIAIGNIPMEIFLANLQILPIHHCLGGIVIARLVIPAHDTTTPLDCLQILKDGTPLCESRLSRDGLNNPRLVSKEVVLNYLTLEAVAKRDCQRAPHVDNVTTVKNHIVDLLNGQVLNLSNVSGIHPDHLI